MMRPTQEEQLQAQAGLEEARAALAAFRKAEDDVSSVRVLNEIGGLHLELEQLGQAELSFRSAFLLAQRIGNTELRVRIQLNRAQVAYAQKQLDAAHDFCDDAFIEHTSTGSESGLAESYLLYAQLYRDQRNLDLAGTHFTLAARLAKASGNLAIEADAHREHARMHIQNGALDEALKLLDRAAECLREIPQETRTAAVERKANQLERMRHSVVVRLGADAQ